MRWLRRVIGGAKAVVRGRRAEAELDEELRAYLEAAAAEKMRGGMSREDAVRASRIETGLVNMDGVKDRVRQAGWEGWADTLWQDLRVAARQLSRDRGFTIAAVAALGLGIGLNTSVFAIVNAAFLRDVPLEAPDRLLAVHLRDGRAPQPGRDIAGISGPGGPVVAASYAELLDWRDETTSFEGLTAHAPGTMNLSGDGEPAERFGGSYLTANTFRVLRVAPILGRDFVDADDEVGAPGVVMLGYAAWQSRYDGDPSVVGRSVRVNDLPATIIGVMPEGFNYPVVDQLWQSISSSPDFVGLADDTRNLSVVARLAVGADIDRARAELDAVLTRRAETFPGMYRDIVSFARPLRERYATPPVPMILALMGAVGFVLLIAYANLANLLLARSVRRSREIAIRMALGSSQSRVVGQFLVECLLIAVAGGALGFVVSLYGVKEIAIAFEPIRPGVPLGTNRPFWVDISPNAILYAFVGLLSLASAVAFGLLPAWQMSKTDVNETLKAESRSVGSPNLRRWATRLLVAELALALMLLSGAGLQWLTFLDQYRQDTVIDTSGLVTMRLSLPPQKYSTPADRRRFLDVLNQRLGEMTVFSAVTMASHVPLEFGAPAREVFVERVDQTSSEKPPLISYLLTGTRYFETLGLPIVRGRGISEMDARPGHEGAVVDERFAARFFPGEDPVGRRIRVGEAGVWYTVVGVARALPQSGPLPERRPIVYAPLQAEPEPAGQAAIIVKGPLEPASETLRRTVQAMDPALPLFAIETLDQSRARGRFPSRLIGTWFSTIAVAALVLATVGVFAITAHGVTERTGEIGVRMALGANARDVVRLFMRRAIGQVTVAVVLGLAGSVALGAVMGRQDPLTFAVVSAILGSVTLAATWLPARRAARVDPLAVIRRS